MPSQAGRASFPLDFSQLSFLISDDQPFTRRLVRSILVGFGSREVYESANGVEAVEVVRTAQPNIIITDLIMPAFNGLRFIKMLREPQSPAKDVPIIVLSGYLTKSAAMMVRAPTRCWSNRSHQSRSTNTSRASCCATTRRGSALPSCKIKEGWPNARKPGH